MRRKVVAKNLFASHTQRDLLLLFSNSFNVVALLSREFISIFSGCEYGGYSSDITRTWPINGRFTAEQETLYDIVFAVQQNILQALDKRPNMTLDHLYELMCGLLGKYLQEIGFIDKSFSYRDLVHAASVFCPHHVSHYLGMDIHDTPTIGRDRPLTPGIVFTVEPGELQSSTIASNSIFTLN